MLSCLMYVTTHGRVASDSAIDEAPRRRGKPRVIIFHYIEYLLPQLLHFVLVKKYPIPGVRVISIINNTRGKRRPPIIAKGKDRFFLDS